MEARRSVRVTVCVLGREVLHVSTDAEPTYDDDQLDDAEPLEAPTTAAPYYSQTGGEFGFAAPATQTIDYPETRWDPQT